MAENNKQLEEAKKLLQEINTLRGKLNQTPLKMTDSEAVQNVQSLRNELKGVQNSFEDIDDSATSLYDQIKAISSEFKGQPSELQKIRGAMRKITSIAEDLKMNEQGIKDLSSKNLDDLTLRLKENRKILDDSTKALVNSQDLSRLAQEDLKAVEEHINLVKTGNTLSEDQLDTALASVQAAKNLTDEQKAAYALFLHQGNALNNLNGKIEEQKEHQKEINKLMGVGGAIIGGIDGLMSKLGMNSGIFKQRVQEANKAMQEQAEKVKASGAAGGKLSVLMAGLGPLAKGFGEALLDPLSIILKIVDAFFKVDKAATDFQRKTGMSAESIAGANSELATSVDFLQTAGELTDQIGMNAAVALGPDLVAGAAGLKNELGLSAENAGMLALNAKLSGNSMAGLEAQVQSATEEFNNTTDSAANSLQVLRDMGKASKSIQAQFASNPGALAKAAAAARKVGMELKEMEGVMDNLLNFEDSIAAEMEAELLTGKELNLNKARELALSNDIEGVSNELFKNAQDVKNFSKMNRFEQESYAKALGMSRDQLAEMAIQKSLLSDMSDEEKAKIRGVTIEESKRMDLQEKMQKSMDKLIQAFTPLLDIIGDLVGILAPALQILGGIVGYAVKFLDTLGIIKPLIIGIVAVMAAGKIASFFGVATTGAMKFAESLKGMKFSFSGMMDSVKSWGAGIKDAFKGGMSGAGKLADTVKDKAGEVTKDAAGRFRDAKGRFAKAPGTDKAADMAGKAKDGLTDKATDQTGDLAGKTKDAKGDGPGGFLKSLGDGLASIGKQFKDVVKGALAIGIAGVALGGSFALALKMVDGVDPVSMLAFAGSIGIFGASLALVGKLGNDAIKGAVAMGIAGVALIPAAYAFSLMAGVDPVMVATLSGSLIVLGLAAALIGNLGGQVIAGALAMGILAVALIPAAYAFSLLKGVDVGSIIAFSVALPLLALATAGLGFIAPFIMAGAAALVVLGLALIPAAAAFGMMAGADIQGVVDKLSVLAEMGPGLIQAGIGLMATAGGLAVFAAALAGGSIASGLTSLFTGGGLIEDLQNLTAMAEPLQSVAGSLTAIAAALGGIGAALAVLETEKLEEMQDLITTAAFAGPAIAAFGAIGDMISGATGGGSGETAKAENNDKLLAKIDELIAITKQGKNINMDGRRVGGTLAAAATNT